MPLYTFKCKKCGNRFEIITSMNERDKVTCSKCDSKEIEQLITGCSINTGNAGKPNTCFGGGCDSSGFGGGG